MQRNVPPSILPTKFHNEFTRRLCVIRQWFKNTTHRRNTKGDKVLIEDEVFVWEGSAEDVKAGRAKLLFWSKGHIVDAGLTNIINWVSSGMVSATYSYGMSESWSGLTTYMRVGTGAGTTAHNTTSLTTQVNTAASSQSGANSNPSAGQWRVSWTATWNAGALSAITISELGLFLWLSSSLGSFQWVTQPSGAVALFSRLSNADGDFSTFTVNTSVPLTIQWNLTLTFA